MPLCTTCGQDNPDVARFCLACGAALGGDEATPQEERRCISVLFVDLVGFTARAERLDPEDVRAILTPYHETVRREIESFGGVVEKFVGDAVMSVFGAPTAYGDDAERAVRAALAVRDSVRALNETDARLDLQPVRRVTVSRHGATPRTSEARTRAAAVRGECRKPPP